MLFLAVFSADQGTDIQGLVADQRKWSGRIHRHRCQNRIYLILKITVQIFFLLFRQLFMLRNDMQSITAQLWQKTSVIRGILHIYKLMCLCVECL